VKWSLPLNLSITLSVTQHFTVTDNSYRLLPWKQLVVSHHLMTADINTLYYFKSFYEAMGREIQMENLYMSLFGLWIITNNLKEPPGMLLLQQLSMF